MIVLYIVLYFMFIYDFWFFWSINFLWEGPTIDIKNVIICEDEKKVWSMYFFLQGFEQIYKHLL